MSTKPPSLVQASSADSLELLAYSVVSEIPTTEPNDRARLGYCVWAWLSERRGTLQHAIRAAGTRTTYSTDQMYDVIRKRLEEKGIKIS